MVKTVTSVAVLFFLVICCCATLVMADLPRLAPCTPNLLYKVGDTWYLVDGYHNRLLKSTHVSRDLASWREMATQLADTHSIASDGQLIVADVSAENRVVGLIASNDVLRQQSVIQGVGERPHRVQYSREKSAFYALSAISGSVSKFERNADGLKLVFSKQIPFLSGRYSRSFSIIDQEAYFVSSPGRIIRANFHDESFTELETIQLPEVAGSPNDIFRASDGWWYISATPQVLIRARSPQDFSAGRFEDVYARWGLKGTPYYLSEYEGLLYIPTVTEYCSLNAIAVGADAKVKPTRILDLGR
jgi:hypothetical protein